MSFVDCSTEVMAETAQGMENGIAMYLKCCFEGANCRKKLLTDSFQPF